jgi:heptosyltransferase-2
MGEDEHEVSRYLDLVAAAGARRAGLKEARTFIHLTESDRQFARQFLENGWASAGALIGIQPGTSPAMRWKQWPLDRYRELIKRILDEKPHSHLILFGSAAEAEMIRDLAEGLGDRVKVAAGKTSVKQVAALIEQCDLLVCNDSGLMHAAVAVDTPVVAIYGPTDFNRTAPLGAGHTIIRHALPCSPCFRLEGDEQVRLCPHHDCLMTITPDEVLRPVVRIASQAPADARAGVEKR